MLKSDSTHERGVLLLGVTGQVGGALIPAFRGRSLVALHRRHADFSRPESLRSVVRELGPSVILNSAAYTAVDRAESDRELADTINHLAVKVLAEEAERCGALLVHYSTDYVFDGSKEEPWLETDAPGPLNVYGETKLAGERAITDSCRRHVILRTSWVYSERGSNFLLTMLRLGRQRPGLRIVDDQWGAPTSASALAAATRCIVDQFYLATRSEADEHGWIEKYAGIYHASCAGRTNWCDFANAIFDVAAGHGSAHRPQVEGIPSAQYPTPARRPKNSVLSTQKLQQAFQVQLPPWQSALEAAFNTLAQQAGPPS